MPSPDEASWRLVRLEVRKNSGTRVDLEFLRPAEWVDAQDLFVGRVLETAVPELELHAYGIVTAIEPCPPLAPGEGSLVTGRFVTRNVTQVTRVLFADGTELSGTHQHPIWSEDKQDWVKLGKLAIGEHVRSQSGPLAVVEVEVLVDPQPVYNIEVFGEHVYEVGGAGILTHNAAGEFDCSRYLQLLLKRNAGTLTDALERREYASLLKELKDIDFGSYLRGRIGDYTKFNPDMLSPHAHHILFKSGLGRKQKELVAEGLEILLRYDIDPIYGLENLVWAPWHAKGQHGIVALEKVVIALRRADKTGEGYPAIKKALNAMGEIAAART